MRLLTDNTDLASLRALQRQVFAGFACLRADWVARIGATVVALPADGGLEEDHLPPILAACAPLADRTWIATDANPTDPPGTGRAFAFHMTAAELAAVQAELEFLPTYIFDEQLTTALTFSPLDYGIAAATSEVIDRLTGGFTSALAEFQRHVTELEDGETERVVANLRRSFAPALAHFHPGPGSDFHPHLPGQPAAWLEKLPTHATVSYRSFHPSHMVWPTVIVPQTLTCSADPVVATAGGRVPGLTVVVGQSSRDLTGISPHPAALELVYPANTAFSYLGEHQLGELPVRLYEEVQLGAGGITPPSLNVEAALAAVAEELAAHRDDPLPVPADYCQRFVGESGSI
ncbi:hypothetical protein [Buchananella hordeovulneris]|uniref:Uncharacterized protein n=1 Tax=Buchananella hordeovulneris TaxID=52770 RepID=A0A1Q5PU98_9ACTO|nr:hypothetical protein [Buchananella hordeovulneris]OKL51062.1 hypothetical protein BSZ40_09145 [Buchananella hordeovulneris]